MAFGAACIVGLPIAANPFGAQSYSYGKFHWLLMCGALMLGAWLLRWADRPGLAVPGSAVTWRLSAGRGQANRLISVLFAGWVAWLMLTSLVATDRIPALLGDSLRREGAISSLALALLALAVRVTSNDRGRWRSWALVLSLGSVIPMCATLLQFLASDMTLRVTLIGTLGNPVFLGALMMLALPLSIAQWLAATSRMQRGVWAAAGSMQAVALLLSMSRGPLIGAVIAIWALLLWAAMVRRQRLLLGLSLAVPALALLVLAGITLTPAVVEQVPALARFQFKASGSSDARLGIWAAGLSLFAEADWVRQLFGYGVEAGAMVYMSYMPAWVFRIEGLGLSVDRMHCQMLETLLATGVIGVLIELALFGAVMHRCLAPIGLRLGLFRACGIALLAAGIFAVAGAGLFGRAVWPSMFGIGYAAGWLGIWLAGQWTCAKAPPGEVVPADSPAGTKDRFLLAAAAVALLAYWVEAQLGVNDVSVRAFAFVLAALAVAYPAATAGHRVDDARAGLEPAMPLTSAVTASRIDLPVHWVVWPALPLVFLTMAPPVQGATAWLAPAMASLGMALLAAAVLCAFGWFCHRTEMSTPPEAPLPGSTRKALWRFAAVLPLYAACHYLMLASLAGDTVDSTGAETTLTIFFWWVIGLALLAAGAAGLAAFGRVPHAPLARFADHPAWASGAGAMAGLLVTGAVYFSIQDSRAGIATKLAQWAAAQGKSAQALRYFSDATVFSPTQRTAWINLSQVEFGQALGAARDTGAPGQARAALVQGHLGRSIAAAERGLVNAAADPFLLALLGETRTLEAAPFAADIFGGEAARKGHGQEAIRYFEQSLKTRGTHPFTLRSLVRLELDYGTPARAQEFAERLIKSDPKSDIGYEERALIALRANDMQGFAATLRSGIEMTGGAVSLRRPLAEFLFRQGDIPGATREMEAIVAQTPKDWIAVRDLIRLYLRQNANDKALPLAKSARQFVPEPERASLEDLLRNLEPQPFTGGGLKP